MVYVDINTPRIFVRLEILGETLSVRDNYITRNLLQASLNLTVNKVILTVKTEQQALQLNMERTQYYKVKIIEYTINQNIDEKQNILLAVNASNTHNNF